MTSVFCATEQNIVLMNDMIEIREIIELAQQHSNPDRVLIEKLKEMIDTIHELLNTSRELEILTRRSSFHLVR